LDILDILLEIDICMYVCKEEGVQVFVGAAAPAVRMAHLHT
jgi:hypothetical protein